MLTSRLTDNHARAMRVAEVVSDYRNLQHYIAQINARPNAEEFYLEGYALIRACVADAQAVLTAPFSAGNADTGGNADAETAQLHS